MSNLYMLIGAPASGKSTWRSKFVQEHSDRNFVQLSTDDLIDIWAEQHSMTYSEAFVHSDFSFKTVEAEMKNNFRNALAEGHDIILDRTNMNVNSRRKLLSQVPNNYKTIAVIFEVERAELDRRLENRAQETGKSIPKSVVDNMLAGYEAPTTSEFNIVMEA